VTSFLLELRVCILCDRIVSMRTAFFTTLAYCTLFIDAYMSLAVIATRMMKAEFAPRLLLMDSSRISEGTRFGVLFIATWTMFLAIGCLRSSKESTDGSHFPGMIWFVSVVVVVWIAYLAPLLV
jgi:hypothetical protein